MSCPRERCSIILLLAAMIVIPLHAQPPQVPPATAPAMVNPNVRLNLAALDAHGKAVSDLQSEELQVDDAGKPQQIVYFRRDSANRSAGAKLAAREGSNNSGGPDPRAIVVLFDLLNENLGNRGYSAEQLVHALEKLETPDYVYIYLLTKQGRLFAVRPVPPLGELLRPAGPWIQHLHEVMDHALQTVLSLKALDLKLSPDFIPVTHRSLMEVATQTTAFPGRKSLLWITQGVPLYLRDVNNEIFDYTPQLRLMSAAMNRGNVAVVPIVPDLQSGSATLNGQEMLQTLSDLTGGPPNIYSDMPGALDQAVQTARASYRIVYEPPAKNWDGKFHKIKITCKRAGVRLQVQQGYLANRAQWMSADNEKTAMDVADASPFDMREIGLQASIPQDGPAKDRLQIRVNLSDVLLTHDGERYQGSLLVSITRFFQGGQRPPVFSTSPITLNLTAKERDDLMASGLEMGDKDPIGSEFEKVRIVVLDRGSGSIGALNFALR